MKRLKKIFMKILFAVFLLVAVVAVLVTAFVYIHPAFGGKASGKSLEIIQSSKNWNGNIFVNLIPTKISTRTKNSPDITTMLKEMLFPPDDKNPSEKLPSKKFDKNNFHNGDMAWFGHSTVLFKTDDKIILADPVFHNASPVPGTVKSFAVVEQTKIADLPDSIDVVIISHDHYDHLDYRAIQELDKKVERFFVGLGVKAHLLRWGVADEKIQEFDWYNETNLANIHFVFTPTRHFSGRGLTDRSKTLWGSWVVQGSDLKIFFSGDSGYFDEFKVIGKKYGPFDIAFIEDGAYNNDWAEIHMKPEDSVQTSLDLQATYMAPIHWGKFDLSRHTWKEPIERTLKASKQKHIDLATPVIGKTFNLSNIPTLKWWENIK